jgi:TonB family protein
MLLTHPDTQRTRTASGMLSLAIHGGAVALIFTITPAHEIRHAAETTVAMVTPLIAPYIPSAAPTPARGNGGGGGGGGDRSPLPASKGRLPRFSPRQFTPPAAVVYNQAPKLLMEPTIVVEPSARVPNVDMAVFGDPLGKIGPPSNGPGSGGGIGSGYGGGVGSGKGPGYGPGEGGGFGGGIRGGRGSVTQAVLLKKTEPEYTDEARKARLQGMVALLVEIGTDGFAHNPQIRSSLGLGLDERAAEAVLKWRFRPYMKDGVPVPGSALVQVYFHLL